MTTFGEMKRDGTMQSIAHSLNRIAGCLEAAEARARPADVDPESIGALAIWREEVTSRETLLGFSDWLAWRSTTDQGDSK